MRLCVCVHMHTFAGAGGSEDGNTLIKDAKVCEEIGCALKYNNPCEKPYIMNAVGGFLRPRQGLMDSGHLNGKRAKVSLIPLP